MGLSVVDYQVLIWTDEAKKVLEKWGSPQGDGGALVLYTPP